MFSRPRVLTCCDVHGSQDARTKDVYKKKAEEDRLRFEAETLAAQEEAGSTPVRVDEAVAARGQGEAAVAAAGAGAGGREDELDGGHSDATEPARVAGGGSPDEITG